MSQRDHTCFLTPCKSIDMQGVFISTHRFTDLPSELMRIKNPDA